VVDGDREGGRGSKPDEGKEMVAVEDQTISNLRSKEESELVVSSSRRTQFLREKRLDCSRAKGYKEGDRNVENEDTKRGGSCKKSKRRWDGVRREEAMRRWSRKIVRQKRYKVRYTPTIRERGDGCGVWIDWIDCEICEKGREEPRTRRELVKLPIHHPPSPPSPPHQL